MTLTIKYKKKLTIHKNYCIFFPFLIENISNLSYEEMLKEYADKSAKHWTTTLLDILIYLCPSDNWRSLWNVFASFVGLCSCSAPYSYLYLKWAVLILLPWKEWSFGLFDLPSSPLWGSVLTGWLFPQTF